MNRNAPSYNAENDSEVVNLDELDLKIIEMLLHEGARTMEIAKRLGSPLSTVQRRVRNLFETGVVSRKVELDYSRLGLKRGVIFVYLKDGDASEVAQQVASMEGVVSVSVQIGNADVLGFLAYKDSRQLFELTSGVRKMEGVDRVLWSEEMYSRSSSSNPTAFASILCWARH